MFHGDVCYKCGKNGMPFWNKDKHSSETARKCQECGAIESKEPNCSTSNSSSK